MPKDTIVVSLPDPQENDVPTASESSMKKEPYCSEKPVSPTPSETPRAEEADVPQDKWNRPLSNIAKVGYTFYSFFMFGLNDSSYGVIIPQLESYYHVSYLTVSLVFLSPVAGYIVSTLLSGMIQTRFGRFGIVVLSFFSHAIAYIVACLHPPFYVLVVAYMLVGLGNGAKAAAWNSFVGSLKQSNEVLGLLHGCYGLGATVMPLVASALLRMSSFHWFMVYYLLAGAAALDCTIGVIVFAKDRGTFRKSKRNSSGSGGTDSSSSSSAASDEESPHHQNHHQHQHLYPLDSINNIEGTLQRVSSAAQVGTVPVRMPRIPSDSDGQVAPSVTAAKVRSATLECLRSRVVLICCVYLVAYVGSEVSLGGWVVSFMMEVRHGSAMASGIVSSGFWAGITAGRMVLGFVTGRLFPSETVAVSCYLACAVAIELLFWLVPSFYASAVAASFLGFFLGPLFPAVIVCVSRLLPKRMLLPAIGICSAVGASGASFIPFIVGAVAQAKGVRSLQPVILALLSFCLIIWQFMPKLPAKKNL